ncbi:chorismate--pyruvate lyase, partial [Corynebacterium pseudodiphtheriticum]
MPHSIAPSDACQWLPQSLLSPVPAPLTLNWLFNEDSLTRRLTRLSDDG